MIQIDDADFLAQLQAGLLPYDIQVTLKFMDGTTCKSGKGKDFQIQEDSVVKLSGNSMGGPYPLGGCMIGGFDFCYYDNETLRAKDWTDATFDVMLFYRIYDTDGKSSVKSLSFRNYYVGDHGDISAGIVQVRGFDAMQWLDLQYIKKSDFNIYADSNGLVKGNNFLSVLLLTSPILSYTTDIDISGREVYVKGNWEQMTKRQALQYFCIILGAYAYINEKGRLVIKQLKIPIEPTDATDLDSTPCFELNANNTIISGIRVSTTEEGKEYVEGDESGYVIDTPSNPFWCWTWPSSVYPYYPYNYKPERFRNLRIQYIPYGNISIISNPLYEPGDYFRSEKWTYTSIEGFKKYIFFPANQIEWRRSSRMSIMAEADAPILADLRRSGSAGTSQAGTSETFATGTVTLSDEMTFPDRTRYYRTIELAGIVPAKYRNSYAVLATANSGTITSIIKNQNFVMIYGDTQGMTVDYEIKKKTTADSTTAQTTAVTTDYGALALNHIQTTQGGYTV